MARIAPLTRKEYVVARDIRDHLREALEQHADVLTGPTRMDFDERVRVLGDAMREHEGRGWLGRRLTRSARGSERRLHPVLREWADELEASGRAKLARQNDEAPDLSAGG